MQGDPKALEPVVTVACEFVVLIVVVEELEFSTLYLGKKKMEWELTVPHKQPV